MARPSAGLLPYRRNAQGPELLIAHMGGPFWARKDAGAWTIIKGEYEDETPIEAARREYEEETGHSPPDGPFLPLGERQLRSGKLLTIWAVEADFDPANLRPGTFEMEWPPWSGRRQRFPEIDRVEWCSPAEARRLLTGSQTTFVDRLLTILGNEPGR